MSDSPFLDKLHAWRDSTDPVERVVYDLWKDVTDRRGWRQASYGFDDEICSEILDVWAAIIRPGVKLEGE